MQVTPFAFSGKWTWVFKKLIASLLIASLKKNMATEAYCVKCKAKRDMKDEKEVEMNGKGGKKRAALKGTCPTCGTGMFKILGMSGK